MKFLFDRQRNKYKILMKYISVFLAFIMAFNGGIISCYAMGAGVPEKLEMESILSDYIKDVINLDGVKSIDTEKSTDTELYLNMKDDSTTVYTFSEPVTYIDENGDLKCKGNDIIKQTNKENKDLGYNYSNNQNDYRINISTDSSKGILVEYGDNSFSLAPISDSSVNGSVSNGKTEFEYADLLGENTLMKYFLQINGIKEEIILDDKTDTNIFKSILKTKDCAPFINEDGSISLISSQTGKEVQRFVAPFAYDNAYVAGIADEHFCSECKYILEENAENEYTISVVVSKNWLNSSNTIYPVTIDPSTSNIYNYYDASVYSLKPTTSYGSSTTCSIGYNPEYGAGRIYTQFTLPNDISKYATINSARLWESELTGGTTSLIVTPYIVTSTWSESSITWDKQPSYDENVPLESKTLNGDSMDDPYDCNIYSFNIKNAVEEWIKGTANYGLVFISSAEDNSRSIWKTLAAKNYISTDYRPYTVINYVNDVRAPRITNVTGNPTEWTNEDVTLTINATDDVYSAVSGIASYSFSKSEEGYSAQSSPSLTVSSNGKYYARVCDNAGNISTATVINVDKIDKVKPLISSVTGNPTSRTKDDAVLVASATDELSGIAEYSFSETEGEYSWQSDSKKSLSENGVVYVSVKDKAGNISNETTVNVNKIDKSKPSDPVITGNANEWTKEDVTLTAVSVDEESKVVEYSFSTSSSTYSWQAEPYKTFSSNCTVYPSFKDSDGEISSAEPVKISKIDKTCPSKPSVSAEYGDEKVILTVTSADSDSGLSEYSFSETEGVYNWQKNNNMEFSENTLVYIYAKDVVGNISPVCTKKIYIGDKTAPTIQGITGNATKWTNSSVTLNVVGASDDETGLSSTAYSFSSSENAYSWQGSNSKSFSSNQTVYIYVRDDAGNIANVGTVVIDKIDKTSPTINRITRNDKNGITTLTIEASDSQSGVTNYSLSDRPYNQNGNSVSFPTDKYNYVYIQVKDGAGNTTTRLYTFYYPQCYKENGRVYAYNPNPSTNDTIYYRTSRVIFTSWETYSKSGFVSPNEKTYLTYIKPWIMLSRDVDNAKTFYTDDIPTLRDTYVAGKYEESEIDATFTYKDVSFDFMRTFDNKENSWFFSVNSSLKHDISANRIDAVFPDNTKISFLPKTLTSYYDLHGDYIINANKDPDGKILSYDLELNGQKYIYNSEGTLVAVESKNGAKIAFNRYDDKIVAFDGAGREYILNLFAEKNITSITDPSGGNIKYTYNSNSRLSKIVDQAGITLNTYNYDSKGRVIKCNDKSFTYDSSNRVTSQVSDSGAYINYTYSGNTVNSVTSTEQTTVVTYNEYGDITYTEDEYGNSVTFTYDDKRHLIKKETSGGETTNYAYGSNGMLQSESSDNLVVNYSYDESDNCVRKETITPDYNKYEYYEYDDMGNVTTFAKLKTDFNGEAPLKYDKSLNCFDVFEYVYADGLVSSYYNKTDDETGAYSYDLYGNRIKSEVIKNGMTKTETSIYDVNGNLLSLTKDEKTCVYIYDDAGRILLKNDNGKCTRMLYDEVGRMIQKINPEDYDASKDGLPESNTYSDVKAGHTYVYADNGTLTSETNHLGRTTKYFYNDIGSKIREEFDIYKMYYLNHGELYQIKIANTTIVSYDYDDNYNLMSESYANDDVIRYVYNENGNLIEQYHNSNALPYVTYTYDDNDRVIEKINTDVSLKYIYGADGKISVYNTDNDSLVQSYFESEEDNNSKMLTVFENHFGSDYNSVIKTNSISYNFADKGFEYNFTGSTDTITSAVIKNISGSKIILLDYTYDDSGNIINKLYSYGNDSLNFSAQYDSESRIISSSNGSISRNYTYDANGQLIGVRGSDYSASYEYDSRGNITSKTVNGVKTSFGYSNTGWKDVLYAVDDVELTYDANGNLLTYGEKEHTWNSGRLLQSVSDGNNAYTYKYDEKGARISKTVNGENTYFNYCNGRLVAQSDGNNKIYFQYDFSGLPIGFIYNDTQYYYITNQMNDVIGITNESGSLLAKYSYDEWGNLLSITADSSNIALANANPLRYRGYYFDAETGYYCINSRYYNPKLCRFISPDYTTNQDKESVYGLNTFAYAKNNPVNKA